MAKRVAKEIRVHGRVQGVGFRYHARNAASRIGVTGWVRNEPDGTVLSHVEGTQEQLRRFEEYLRDGPSFSRVTRLDARSIPVQGTYSTFSIDF